MALGDSGADRRLVLTLGETKWGEQLGQPHLERLRHIRGLLSGRREIDVTGAKLLCASGAGFTPELRAAAAVGEVILLDLERLYRGG